MKSSWFLITRDARASREKRYWEHRARSGRQRYTEEGSRRRRSMIMWSDDKAESPVPLWWSHHPATRSRREWILFGLALIFPSDNTRRACMLGVFSISPQENSVKSYKCTRIMPYISAARRQAACSYKDPMKPWTEQIDCWEMPLQKRMTTENKNKVIPRLVLRNCLPVELKWYMSNCWNGLCTLLPFQL